MTAALEGGEWSAARPGRTLTPGKTRYPFYRRLGGPQGRSGREEKSRPHRDSIPDRPARSSVAIPTELPHVCVILEEFLTAQLRLSEDSNETNTLLYLSLMPSYIIPNQRPLCFLQILIKFGFSRHICICPPVLL